MIEVVPGSTLIETFFAKYGIAFTLLVMYQGLFGGMSFSNKPAIVKELSDNVLFKYLTLFCIAFTATKDVEISLISMLFFVILIHMLRTPKEREDVTWMTLI